MFASSWHLFHSIGYQLVYLPTTQCALYYTVPYSIVLYSTVQYRTVLTAQHSTVQRLYAGTRAGRQMQGARRAPGVKHLFLSFPVQGARRGSFSLLVGSYAALARTHQGHTRGRPQI